MSKVVFNACHGGFCLSRAAIERLAAMGVPGAAEFLAHPGLTHFSACDVPRHDPRLVRVVEEMGEAANGALADLRVMDLGEGPCAYRIIEDDGKERVKVVECDAIAPGPEHDMLRRIVEAWREDEIGQIDGALIEEAEALLGIERDLAECPRCGSNMLAADDAECGSAKCVAFRAWAASQPQKDVEDRR